MKYTIEGFSQKIAIRMGLKAEDLVILRWFVDFYATGKMARMISSDGGEFYWVDYKTVLEELPIIQCNKRNLSSRFERLVNAGVLRHATIKSKAGTYAAYAFGDFYNTLVFGDEDTTQDGEPRSPKSDYPVVQNQTTRSSETDHPVVRNQTTPLSENGRTNIHLQEDSSTKDSSTKEILEESNDSSFSDEPKSGEKIDYQAIADSYNGICHNLPEVTRLSEKRKGAIKARLSSGYSEADLIRAFCMASESKFLSGGNDRNWRADFDWIIRDANLAKILDGKYTDEKGKTGEFGRAKNSDAIARWNLKSAID